jgi:hypothetical protein
MSFAVVLIAMGVAVLVTLRMWNMQKRQWIARCIDYDPQWEGVVNCYGLISISQADDNSYPVQDNKEPGAIIATVRKSDDFLVKNGDMYLINQEPPNCGAVYCPDVLVNGQAPKYLIINTTTGKETAYGNIQDASASDQAIFQSLATQN